jgi:hypothetical protein
MRRLLLLLPLLVLVACSDDGDTAAPATTATTPTTSTTVGGDVDLVLTEDYACGYGVAVGSEDQTVGLFVHSVDHDPTTPGGEIGGGEWEGELRTGTDLFANWCTDVIFEPEAEVDETVALASGTIELDTPPEVDSCNHRVDARLRDLVLEDGRDLANLDVAAIGWGCVPG